MENLSIMREPGAREATGLPHSTFRLRIKQGLFPPPIKIGGNKASGWPSHEVNAVVSAMVAGRSQEDIKELVKALIAKRQEIFKSMSMQYLDGEVA